MWLKQWEWMRLPPRNTKWKDKRRERVNIINMEHKQTWKEERERAIREIGDEQEKVEPYGEMGMCQRPKVRWTRDLEPIGLCTEVMWWKLRSDYCWLKSKDGGITGYSAKVAGEGLAVGLLGTSVQASEGQGVQETDIQPHILSPPSAFRPMEGLLAEVPNCLALNNKAVARAFLVCLSILGTPSLAPWEQTLFCPHQGLAAALGTQEA